MNLNFIPLTADSPYLEDAVAVYHEYTPGAMRYQTEFFVSHMAHLDYIGILARAEGKILGLAFGSRSLCGQWWHDQVAQRVGADHQALQNAWVLTQLNVLKAYRNRGIGKRLHDAIIKQQPCARLLLSTPVSNAGAQRFYERHGWGFLHKGFEFFPGDEPYAIMRKELKG